MARKFNTTIRDTFKEPKELIIDEVKIVQDRWPKKMSKSYNNTIHFLLHDEVKKAVIVFLRFKKAVEDSKDLNKIKFLLYTNYS